MKKTAVEAPPQPPTGDLLFQPDELPPWWQYKRYSPDNVQRINEYFEKNAAYLEYGLSADVNENLKQLASKIGAPLLPQLITVDQADQDKKDFPDFGSQMPNINQTDSVKQDEPLEPSAQTDIPKLPFFIINSLKLDLCTLKILNIALKSASVKVLRINNSIFDDETLNELLSLILKNKISKLFFDWNNLESCTGKQEFFQNLFKKCTQLEVVTLRHCNIDNTVFQLICQSIEETKSSSQLKFIDLFSNSFSDDSLAYLDKLLEGYDKINYIGLGSNNLHNLQALFRHIGKRVLSPEQLVEYRQKEQEREEIIHRNSKAKGKQLEEVPYLMPLKDVGGDKFAYFFNEQLQLLNLAHNNIGEQDKELLDTFLGSCFEGFTLQVSGSQFDKKTIEKFKKKYNKKINFC